MVGIDIVKISRIAEAMENENFCDKILNKEEISYAFSKSKEITKFGFDSVSMTVAGLFASKEAVLKAMGVGITNGFGFKDITINHDKMGAPVVVLSDKLNSFMKKDILRAGAGIAVSIAHDGEYATAIATIFRNCPHS